MNDIKLVNEGAIAEQLAGQLLRTAIPKYIDPELYYWLREKTGSEADVDYFDETDAYYPFWYNIRTLCKAFLF